MIFTYEKDDVVRTVWLESSHQRPRSGLLFMHGYSRTYEGNQLVVETSRFTFDPEGFAGDVINAPSSTQKRLVERYSRNGDTLRLDLVAEDPIFLLGPITPWLRRPASRSLALELRSGLSAAQSARRQIEAARSADQSEELTMKAGAFIGALLFCAAVTLTAHHGQALSSTSRIVELKGTVKEWRFINPHPILVLEAPDEKGVRTEWDIYFQTRRHLHCADRALPQTRSRWARPSPSKAIRQKIGAPGVDVLGKGTGVTRADGRRAVAAEAKRTLKAAVYHRYGPPDVVRIEEVPTPHPKANELLVKVRATTVSAGDSRLRSARACHRGLVC